MRPIPADERMVQNRLITLTQTETKTLRHTATDFPGPSLSYTGADPPEHFRSERFIALSIFVLSLLYLCVLRSHSGVDPDEGIILQGAQRILEGQVLYRDFFSFYTPGSYYFFALIFRVFGDSYAVAHTALAIFGAIFSPITYLLARRVCGRQASLLVTGVMTVTAMPWRFLVIHNWDSTLLACLALYCAVRLLESPSTAWSFAAATFTSLTALFEQSKGAGLLLGLGAGFLVIGFRSKPLKLFTRSQLIAFAIGLCWPFVTTFIYFALHHALTAMLASWLWPLQHYSRANRVPYGYDNLTGNSRDRLFATASLGVRLFAILVFSARTWVPFVPILALPLLARLIFRRWRRLSAGPKWAHYVLVSATISGLLASVVIARADYLHFVYLHPIFFLVLAWLLDGRDIRHPLFMRIAPVVGFCMSMSLLAIAGQSLFALRGDYRVNTRRGTITMATPEKVITLVQSRVAPGEKILIYPYNSTYYYLTQTYSPTRFDFYQPGMHTEEQLREMLAEFSSQPTPVVLYEPNFTRHLREAWPNTSATSVARDVLAEYIEREYRPCAMLNSEIQFMMRKDLECPDEARQSL
jgi:4-amino-4-deoxy-L-arabinose transferase-like glycosyltransferase